MMGTTLVMANIDPFPDCSNGCSAMPWLATFLQDFVFSHSNTMNEIVSVVSSRVPQVVC